MDIKNILIILIGATHIFMGVLVVLKKGKFPSNRWFSGFLLALVAWCFAMVFYRMTPDVESTFFWTKILYETALFIPLTFIFFTLYFPQEKTRLNKLWQIIFFIPTILLGILTYKNGMVITGVELPLEGEKIINWGPYYLLYNFYIVVYFLIAFLFLFKEFIKNQGVVKTQIKFILFGTFVPTILANFSNLLLPTFGIFDFNWFGQVVSIVMSAFIFYAISKHHLLDVKVIAAETITYIILLNFVIQIFISESFYGLIINIVLFILAAFFSFIVIRSVYKEIEQRERAEKLAEDLKYANEQLRELNEREKEFLSFASHQLKSPLTSIKGYASLIMEESFGKVSDSVYEAVRKIFISSNSMTRSVNDFLNVSRIEQGRLKYDTSVFDLADLAREVVAELKPSASKKNIPLKVLIEEDEKYIVEADKIKMEQVITNLIDNAIKYIQEGEIEVSVSRMKGEDGKDKIRIAVSDSGIGMEQDIIDALFKKYKRAKNAEQKKIEGTGLGLYIAKKMVEGMGGRVWAESDGEDKGSTFYAELLAV